MDFKDGFLEGFFITLLVESEPLQPPYPNPITKKERKPIKEDILCCAINKAKVEKFLKSMNEANKKLLIQDLDNFYGKYRYKPAHVLWVLRHKMGLQDGKKYEEFILKEAGTDNLLCQTFDRLMLLHLEDKDYFPSLLLRMRYGIGEDGQPITLPNQQATNTDKEDWKGTLRSLAEKVANDPAFLMDNGYTNWKKASEAYTLNGVEITSRQLQNNYKYPKK